MDSYKYIETSSAPDIKGLVRNMDLWVALEKAEPTADGSSTTKADATQPSDKPHRNEQQQAQGAGQLSAGLCLCCVA